MPTRIKKIGKVWIAVDKNTGKTVGHSDSKKNISIFASKRDAAHKPVRL